MPASTAIANFNNLLTRVASEKASDLHITVGEPPSIRKGGLLVSLQSEPPVTQGFLEEVIASFLPDNLKQRLSQEREITLANTFLKTIRFRINIFYQKGFLSASFRLVPSVIPPIASLGAPAVFSQWAGEEKGMVIVAGPFGCGKTTSMASFVDSINQNKQEYIITVEEPIEYIFHSMKSMIIQREVGADVLSVSQALNFLKAEDVDVVMISELKEAQSLISALELASAGRLVISTLSATSVIRAIERIKSSFPASDEARLLALLSENLLGIMAQILVPRVGGGSILVAEVLTMTPAVMSTIKDGKIYQLQSIIQTSREAGMISLERSLAELVKTGEVSQETAKEYINDENIFKAALMT